MAAATSMTPGGDVEAARTAVQIAATVISNAATAAEETASAAFLMAYEVAASAARTTAATAAAIQREVAEAAPVRAVTAVTGENSPRTPPNGAPPWHWQQVRLSPGRSRRCKSCTKSTVDCSKPACTTESSPWP